MIWKTDTWRSFEMMRRSGGEFPPLELGPLLMSSSSWIFHRSLLQSTNVYNINNTYYRLQLRRMLEQAFQMSVITNKRTRYMYHYLSHAVLTCWPMNGALLAFSQAQRDHECLYSFNVFSSEQDNIFVRKGGSQGT